MNKFNIIRTIALISLLMLNNFKNHGKYMISKNENTDIMSEVLLRSTQNIGKEFEIQDGLVYINEKKLKTKKAVESFLITLSGSESGGKYNIANKFRFVGKYQFGRAALKSVGYKKTQIDKIRNSIYPITRGRYRFDTSHFTPIQQEIAMQKYMFIYENKLLKNILKKYVGTTFDGIYMSRAGIYAAAHLGGATSVKRYFKSGGKMNRTDANGTSLKTYMRLFEHFEYDENLTFL